MLVVAWIVFLVIGSQTFLKYLGLIIRPVGLPVRLTDLVLFYFDVALTAVSAGIIWGGLLN